MAQWRILSSLADIAPQAWDALHAGDHPFVSHAFLSGLETQGCLRSEWGWTPQHLTLWQGEHLCAAVPGYLKHNSHGEFVFDHAWAQAYAEQGLDYYPKWLFAIPYSPVTGPRLLARTADDRQRLLAAIVDQTRMQALSSAHVNFLADDQERAFGDDWISRIDVQYHWHNRQGWADFDSFLAALDHKHRKNIRQERARIQRTGIRFRVVHGGDAKESDLAAMYGFYRRTFHEYGNPPALTLAFFHHLARHLPQQLVLFLAESAGQPMAGALCLRGGDTLYGRYWGSDGSPVPGLHFETCYYQGIDYCLREGLRRFEPGAQGEHKLARGFLPTLVRSRHWLANPVFAQALRHWCAQEAQAVRHYAATLGAHTPFKSPCPDTPAQLATR